VSESLRVAHEPRVVLVTGASRFVGGGLVARLAAGEAVQRIIAVDSRIPHRDQLRRLGRAEFVRADIRNPMIRKVFAEYEVDTVVHAGLLSRPGSRAGRPAMKDLNVLGSMQLFGVCQKTPTVRRVVLRSTSALYGGGPRDPAKFTEDLAGRTRPASPFARDAGDVEGYLRGLSRRRPDVVTTTLRLVPLIGPQLAARLDQRATWACVPTVLGRDPRIQLLHEQDAFAALEHATLHGPSGVFNIAGDGAMALSQAVARAGRVELPMPYQVFSTLGRSAMGAVMREFTAEQPDFFRYGCVLDTTRMRTELGFTPGWTTIQAFDEFIRAHGRKPVLDPEWITAAERRLLGLIGARQ
jgi:UDP-glucose 4-epimerase